MEEKEFTKTNFYKEVGECEQSFAIYTGETHWKRADTLLCVYVFISGIALQIYICLHYRVIDTASLVSIHHQSQPLSILLTFNPLPLW